MKTFYWLVKREFWEHRGGFLWAPIVTGAIYLFLFIAGIAVAMTFGSHNGLIIGGTDMHMLFKSADAGDIQKVSEATDGLLLFSAGLVMLVSGFVVVFYCLSSLYDDRRDRSILFWKSLPVSNTSTVLSKVVSACVVVPVFAVLIGMLVAVIQLLILTIALSIYGVQAWHLLALAHPFRAIFSSISLIPLSALWALPSVGWYMLCSSWARSVPFLWALVTPIVAGVLVWMFSIMSLFGKSAGWFWLNIVVRMLSSLFPNSFLLWGEVDHHLRSVGSASELSEGNPLLVLSPANAYGVLASANLWIGIACGAAMIAAAIWFRRVRDDS